jgi:hypothetical protein
MRNSLSVISTNAGAIFDHSPTASRVIIASLFTDLDFICVSSWRLSLPIPNTPLLYVHAVAVFHIIVVPSDAT